MRNNNNRGRWMGILLALCLTLPIAETAIASAYPSPPKQEEMQHTRETEVSSYQEYGTYEGYATYNGRATAIPARTIDGRAFVPMYAFVNALTPAEYTFDRSSGYATLQAKNLIITAGLGGTFITANDRPLYGVSANRMIDGTLWVPVSVLAKACGVSVTIGKGSVVLSGSYKALAHAKDFYREDEVYWLSRIISAESKGEPLRGQMAVGNVVLNRTRHRSYPNTIYGVIFQKWQFTPAMNGSIYATPSWLSTIVAKMCLEGYAVSNEVLFFCNPRTSDSHWAQENRPYAFTIGRHAFYY